jgi:hypothetical protein
MAWAEFFYSANIPFAAARSVTFKKAVKHFNLGWSAEVSFV